MPRGRPDNPLASTLGSGQGGPNLFPQPTTQWTPPGQLGLTNFGTTMSGIGQLFGFQGGPATRSAGNPATNGSIPTQIALPGAVYNAQGQITGWLPGYGGSGASNIPGAGMGPLAIGPAGMNFTTGVDMRTGQPTGGGALSVNQPGFQMPPLQQTPTSPFSSNAANWLGTLTGDMSYLRNFAGQPRSVLDDPRFSQWASQLQQGGPDSGFLRQIAQGQGNRFDSTPVWQAMVDAQQRGIDRNAAQLNEYFNTMGGRFSTSFGNAMGDYYSQAAKDQNALLGQMKMMDWDSSQNRFLNAAGQMYGTDAQLRNLLFGAQTGLAESALGRQFNAAGQLGNFAFGAGSQLANQDFSNYQLQRNQAFQSALQNAGMAYGAANNLFQGGVTGAQNLYGGVMNAMGNLYGTENQAANTLFGAQQNHIVNSMAQQLQAQGMSAQVANMLATQWAGNIGLGSQLGQGQFATLQNNIDRLYQEWLRTQPQYNPLLPYMWQGATATQPMYFPSYAPNTSGQIYGGIAGIMGALPGLLRSLGVGG